jgi:uncharacterized protein (TIGR02145 family)
MKKIKDIDGNVYTEIKIGKQVWMVENLRTTKFNDGSSIINITSEEQWNDASRPGYCWYDNDIDNKNTYGALYNWYAVESGILCPKGWHVPSDAEWTQLEEYLIANGYNYDGTTTSNKIAISLANAKGWFASDDVGAIGNTNTAYDAFRNKSGFSALPGGYRLSNGAFFNIGSNGHWWCSTQYNTLYAWYRYLYYDYSVVSRYYYNKESGFSVRCMRD